MRIIDITILVGAGFLIGLFAWEWMMDRVKRREG